MWRRTKPYHQSIVDKIAKIDQNTEHVGPKLEAYCELLRDTTIPKGHHSDVALALRSKADELRIMGLMWVTDTLCAIEEQREAVEQPGQHREKDCLSGRDPSIQPFRGNI